MGKALVIKGADFSANGIQEVYDITSIIASSISFKPQNSLKNLNRTDTDSNTKRCCFVATTFASLGIDTTGYTKLTLKVKSDYDYILGTGIAPDSQTGWQGWSGTTGGQTFNWVTANNEATATLDSTTLALSMNLRHADNTTEFASTAVLTDIVESITLHN